MPQRPPLTRDEYRARFPTEKERTRALAVAEDIRKFEITLYWQRAAYFWAFIAVAFAGYVALAAEPGSESLRLLVSCVGLVFSAAWYLSNRGSKYWQQNWETHVDWLEDEFTGKLYKTVLNRDQLRFLDLTGPYPYSVSRINTALSGFTFLVWAGLSAVSVGQIVGVPKWLAFGSARWVGIILLALLVLAALAALFRSTIGSGEVSIGFVPRNEGADAEPPTKNVPAADSDPLPSWPRGWIFLLALALSALLGWALYLWIRSFTLTGLVLNILGVLILGGVTNTLGRGKGGERSEENGVIRGLLEWRYASHRSVCRLNSQIKLFTDTGWMLVLLGFALQAIEPGKLWYSRGESASKASAQAGQKGS